MGKAAKAKRATERKNKRRAAKALMKAQYQKWADEGRNSKSKRFRAKSKTGSRPVPVRDPKCKNIGDLVSHPEMLETVEKLSTADDILSYYWRLGGQRPRTHQYNGKYKGLIRNRSLSNPIVRRIAEDLHPYRLRTHTGRKLTPDELAV